MKLMKRTNTYKAVNVTFDPNKIEAYSYGWWKFVAVIEGKVVFNNYFYSQSTSKHQRKVKSLMADLGIKIDIEMPIPEGLQPMNLRGRGQASGVTLSDLCIQAENYLCDRFLADEAKRIERNKKSRMKRLKSKLELYLETSVHFRDYEIRSAESFGSYNKIAVHQIVEPQSLEQDVENAINNFSRDGFGSIVFYI